MSEKPDVKIAVLVGITLAFLIAVGNLYWHLEHIRVEMATLRHSVLDEVTKLTDATNQAASSRRAPAAASVETSRRVLDSLKEELTAELGTTKQQAAAASARSKEALSHADTLAERMGEERQSQHKEVVGQLGQIKETEASTSAKVEGVAADIANIKSDVASARYELEQTVSTLKRINGDLGVQSGYIATNAKELQALKILGERNYVEFRVARTGKAERVGDVGIILRKTDMKRNKYSMEVLAGDKKTEKKEKGVNEPVQFYMTRARMPLEIVVNQVQKDFIVGYLSTPKELVAHTD